MEANATDYESNINDASMDNVTIPDEQVRYYIVSWDLFLLAPLSYT